MTMAWRRIGVLLTIVIWNCLVTGAQPQSVSADPLRNTLGLWSRLLHRMAQRTPPSEDDLHFKLDSDQLPNFRSILGQMRANLEASIKESEAVNGSDAGISSNRIINEAMLYRLLPPTNDLLPSSGPKSSNDVAKDQISKPSDKKISEAVQKRSSTSKEKKSTSKAAKAGDEKHDAVGSSDQSLDNDRLKIEILNSAIDYADLVAEGVDNSTKSDSEEAVKSDGLNTLLINSTDIAIENSTTTEEDLSTAATSPEAGLASEAETSTSSTPPIETTPSSEPPTQEAETPEQTSTDSSTTLSSNDSDETSLSEGFYQSGVSSTDSGKDVQGSTTEEDVQTTEKPDESTSVQSHTEMAIDEASAQVKQVIYIPDAETEESTQASSTTTPVSPPTTTVQKAVVTTTTSPKAVPSNVMAPVNSIIDGIGPLILPLLGYKSDKENPYSPYQRRAQGVSTFGGTRQYNPRNGLYTDDSIVGLSTAIAREIYKNTIAQQAAAGSGAVSPTNAQIRRTQPRTPVQDPKSQSPMDQIPVMQSLANLVNQPETVMDKTSQWIPSNILDVVRPMWQDGTKQIQRFQEDLRHFQTSMSSLNNRASSIPHQRFNGMNPQSQNPNVQTAMTSPKRVIEETTGRRLPYRRFMPSPSRYNNRQTPQAETRRAPTPESREIQRTNYWPTKSQPRQPQNEAIMRRPIANPAPTFLPRPPLIQTPSSSQSMMQPQYFANGAGAQNNAAVRPGWLRQLEDREAAAQAWARSNSPSRDFNGMNTLARFGVPSMDLSGPRLFDDSGPLPLPELGFNQDFAENSGLNSALTAEAERISSNTGMFGRGRLPDSSYEASFIAP